MNDVVYQRGVGLLAALVERFGISAERHGGEELEFFKTNLVLLFLLGSALQTLSFGALALLIAPTFVHPLCMLVWACGELCCYVALRRGINRRKVIHANMTLSLGALVCLSMLSGGAMSETLLWASSIVIFASVVEGLQVGLFWAGVTTALLVLLGVLYSFGIKGVAVTLDPQARLIVYLTSIGGSMFLLLGMSWVQSTMFSAVLRRLEQREQELIRAHERALDASTAKSQFLATVSHELRTPLNAIAGYAELILEELDDAGDVLLKPAMVIDDLGRVLSSAQHLRTIIDDVLDLSRIEAGAERPILEEVDVSEVLSTTIESGRSLALAQDNKLYVSLPEVPMVGWTDPRRLRQIMLNLLGNACKFTTRGEVSLTVRLDTIEGNRWLNIAVRDSGEGIPKEHLDHIFEPFSQVDSSSTRVHGGTGLGLAITHQSCLMLGGNIRVESTLGQGSLFEVRLPLFDELPSL